ncbi:hypothetical protein PGB90_004657 [Kerria lacca]
MINYFRLRVTKKTLSLFRTEVPWTISLAVSGIALQLYASYMLVTTNNNTIIKLPLINCGLKGSNTS